MQSRKRRFDINSPLIMEAEMNTPAGDPYPVPPRAAQKYVDALGVETAIDFLLNFGGAELAIPNNPKGKSEVEMIIGPENVQNLISISDNHKHSVPLETKWSAQCLSIRGVSTANISRLLRRSDVTIRKYLKGRNEPGTVIPATYRRNAGD